MKSARVSVKGMMVLVGLAGVVLGLARVHPALGCFVAGAMAIAAVQVQRNGAPAGGEDFVLGERRWLMAFGRTVGAAALLLGLAMLPSLFFALPLGAGGRGHGRRVPEIGRVLTGVALFSLLGWPMSLWIRRWSGWFR